MTHTQTIALYRPLLYSIAIRMVGCIHDAEDIVQDTFLKYLSVDKTKIENTKAYLVRAVTNNCINHLNAFNQKKKEYIETWQNLEISDIINFDSFDLENEISSALAAIHKKLEPAEKAIFLMREVFDYEYDELQEIFEKKKDHCRQIVSRAKEKISLDKIKFKIDLPNHKKLLESFNNACSFGDPEELIANLNREIEERKKLSK
ncbi:MAG: sigma-70 family RNA polymerase sigma factor [Bacteroidota bacterium]